VKELVAGLKGAGLDVYVDVDDPLLAGKADAALAGRLRDRLKECNALLVVASEQSAGSGWIPWELGFAHGAVGRVCVLALDDGARSAHAQREYFELYEWITPADVWARVVMPALQARIESITPAMLEQTEKYFRMAVEQMWKSGLDPAAAMHRFSIDPAHGTAAAGRGLTLGTMDSTTSGG
jgi:hypothetical protein